MAEGLTEATKRKLSNTIKSTGFPIGVFRFYRGCLKIRQGVSFNARNSQLNMDEILQEASNAIPQSHLPPPPLILVTYSGDEVPKESTLLDHCATFKISQPSRLKSSQKLFIISKDDLTAFRAAESQQETQKEQEESDERSEQPTPALPEQFTANHETRSDLSTFELSPVSHQPPNILLDGDEETDAADNDELNTTIVVDDEISFHRRPCAVPRDSQPAPSVAMQSTGGATLGLVSLWKKKYRKTGKNKCEGLEICVRSALTAYRININLSKSTHSRHVTDCEQYCSRQGSIQPQKSYN